MASLGREYLGDYEILRTIGSGAFGKVKLALHSATGKKVALKCVSRSLISSVDLGPRVRREVRFLRRLRHPHIIKLYEVFVTTKEVIIVLEYAGGEMFDYISENGKLHEREARRLFQQLISAIDHCHRRYIVHRDLKPENILLDEDNNVKLADFGLANALSDGEFMRTACGSPNYAAPEVISGRHYAGPEVDIWSCGVILYVMLTGRLPFDDDFVPGLFRKITEGKYVVPKYVSPEAKALLERMLVVDPLRRATVGEVRASAWASQDLPVYLPDLEAQVILQA
ncbi:hypothetical protein BJ684DRAFT_23200 [Piptocephalis cylindrospora]|uniref:non-specific serine/threonine protein kinase n=1 Tax=Piptocephalis cylindrospora TaxID=1907219 RepID=A0A4P9XZ59_9FUNG|nr:hypothetical protein BJ684DRAFT_23200 [Piptocephalis cylindrospora]|eukprot:RKP11758.1 hypothetical protein BJ684DRAFT_23200 [Piptocephalis cylindrospora]